MTKPIGAIFDAGPAIHSTKRVIGAQHNVLLDMINWRPWIELELKYLLNPFSLRGCVSEQEEDQKQLGDIGLPSTTLEKARVVMREELAGLIRMGIGPVRECHDYDVEFLEADWQGLGYNLKIMDMGDRRAIEFERQQKEDALFEELGGFVPERMRTVNSY